MVVRLIKFALYMYVWLTVRCSFYFIDRPTYIVLANEPFSLAWSFTELLEPPVSAAQLCTLIVVPGNSKLRRLCDVILHTTRQPRIFTDNELHLLASFHGISSPAYNCRSYLYERARLEIKCKILKLISSYYDVPVASFT